MAEGIVFDADAVSKDIAEGIAAIQQASTMEELKAIKAKYAGANSAMTRASKAIGSLAKNEKKEAGKVMGKLRADFGRAYGTKEASVKAAQEAAELADSPQAAWCPPSAAQAHGGRRGLLRGHGMADFGRP